MKKFWQLMLVLVFAVAIVGCTGPEDGGKHTTHTYVNGVCTVCNAKEPSSSSFPDGLSCAELPDHENCSSVDTWAWNYNRSGFDGKGMVIKLLSGASEEVDPYHGDYTGERRDEKQRQMTEIEIAYNIDLVIENYPDSAAWGPSRVNWLNDRSADGTLLSVGHIYTISSDWVPSLKNGGSIAELENLVRNTGIFTDLNYDQSDEKNSQYSVGTKVYGYSAGEAHADHFLYYNQQLVTDNQLEDPAKLWNEGRWDWSTFYDYLVTAQAAFDAKTGDDDENKIYAFGGFVNDIARGMLAARGYKLIDNESGTVLFTNPNTVNLYNDLREIVAAEMWSTDSYSSDVSENFKNGKQLFAHGQLWFLSSEMRLKDQVSFPVSVVPYPTAEGAAQPNGTKVEGYLVPMGADSGYAFPQVTNGENGLSTAVLVNIADDFTRGLKPEFDAEDMSARDQYMVFLQKRIESQESIAAVMSVEDYIKDYGYTDYVDIVSKSVGGGSDWAGEGFATWGMSLVSNLEVSPMTTLESKKEIYQKALDEIING